MFRISGVCDMFSARFMASKRYLVTGGLGFIGASLTKALVKAGHTVRVLDNSSRGSAEKLGDTVKDVEIIEGDIRDPAIVDRATKGCECVCHLAFVNGTEYFYKYPAYVLDVGVKGMINVTDSSIRHGVKDFVLASSSEVYQTPAKVPTDEAAALSVPDPLNPRYSYGGGKIISELIAVNYGREHFERTVIFRPHNVYGPAMGYEHVIPQFVLRLQELAAKSSGTINFPIQGDGKQTRSFIYIDDFTDGLMEVINKGLNQNIYHIGTMDEISILDLALRIASLMKISAKVVPGKEAEGATLRRCPDIAKLTALGFKAKHSLEQGLKPTIDWYTAHPASKNIRSTPSLFL